MSLFEMVLALKPNQVRGLYMDEFQYVSLMIISRSGRFRFRSTSHSVLSISLIRRINPASLTAPSQKQIGCCLRHVCPSAYIKASPTLRIFVSLVFAIFTPQKLLTHYDFGKIWAKITSNFTKDPRTLTSVATTRSSLLKQCTLVFSELRLKKQLSIGHGLF
jgi:hypothetical protein